MTRQRALVVFAAAVALLLALNAVVYSLYKQDRDTVSATLHDRLTALGTTTARWLTSSERDSATALTALVDENRLEDAYVVDAGGTVIAGVRTRPGTSVNLLRVDSDRLARALDGSPSVGAGYSIDNAHVDVAYFPIIGTSHVLALEAGQEFKAPAAQVRTTYLVAVALSLLVAVLFSAGLGLALRALERSRTAHGKAERLAAVGQMAAMVAHEVRNPLGILRGQVELARENLPADATPRQRERFGEMLAEIDRLNTLTQEFLGLARDTPLDRSDVDLAALARAVVEDARIGGGDGVRVDADVPDDPVTVLADEAKLRQVLRNLVLNAIQVGGDQTSVRVEVARETDRARITVIDDGPGVPRELAATLFEPFVTARKGGSGLGLAVARRVAEQHGGSIALESTAGTPGARFSVYLPVERT